MTAVNRSTRILKNVGSNWTGSAANAVVVFFLTPFVLHELGQGRYGIWVLTSSVIGYYGMLDLGFRAGVNQYLTRTLALRDYERASDVLSTAVGALSGLGAVMAVLSLAAAGLAPMLFQLPAGLEHEAFWCILIIGGTASVQCALSPFGGVFVATQRFDLANAIGICSRLLSALLVVTALVLGYGLVGVAGATAFVTVLDYLARAYVARRLVPDLTLSRSRIRLGPLRDIGSFGLWNFLISVTRYISLDVQPLLIAALMPVAAVGHYALATSMWYQINQLFTPVGQVLYPAAAELDIKGDRQTLKRLYRDGSRLMLLAVIPTVLIAFVWADDFYRLWIGPQYLSGDPFASVSLLLRILLIGTVLSYVSNVAGQILVAAGHIRRVALLQVGGAAVNLTIALVLVESVGLVGVALASLVAICLVDIVGIPLVLSKQMDIRAGEFLGAAWVRLAIVATVLSVLYVAIHALTWPEGWIGLIMQGIAAVVGAIVTVLSIGITSEERLRFLALPLRRVLAPRSLNRI